MHSINNIPKSWNDITVDSFIQLKEVEREKFHSVLSFRMEQLYVITETNEDDDIWDESTTDDLEQLFKETNWLNVQPSRNFSSEIEIQGVKYFYKGLNTMTLGEFIDLEYYFGISYITQMPIICSILYRQQKIDDWGHVNIEPRQYDIKERSKYFLDLKVPEVYGVLQDYLSFKKRFMDSYQDLFLEPEVDDSQDELPTNIEEQNDEKMQKLMSKWAWERVIYRLGKRNLLKFHEITELPLVLVFNHLSMLKDLKIDD